MIQQEVQSLKQHAVESNQKVNDVLSGKAPLFLNLQSDQQASRPAAIDDSVHTTGSEPAVSALHQYKMSRSLHNVGDVWREYKHGLGGSPSIEYLESTFRNTWRQSVSERKVFSRRQTLYKAIKAKLSNDKMRSRLSKSLKIYEFLRAGPWTSFRNQFNKTIHASR